VKNDIQGKTIDEWKIEYPILEQIIRTREVFWTNPQYAGCSGRIITPSLSEADIQDAEKRLLRFASYIAKVFPKTREAKGIIESPLVNIGKMKKELKELYDQDISGSLYLKCDSHLPISGSVKARGGIYEVLKIAEDIAIEKNMLFETDDYSVIASEKFRELFSKYSIVVGSTGNLGLSIGIMGAALGFKVIVHMSSDAKQWKKALLRAKGVIVIEYDSDYGQAVEAGRVQAQKEENSHFIDDENSHNLFLGYAVAAKRLKQQLEHLKILVDQDHPLFVYLPCGVGGAPGGITFGLKTVFNDHVHCFFAEPTHSPAMLMGLMTRLHDKVSVQEFGIDNVTDADGLAVGRPSGFVGKTLEKEISGVFTIQDQELYRLLRRLADTEGIYLEPSALAGFAGPVKLFTELEGKQYLDKGNLISKMKNAAHIVWATGGSMVPEEMMYDFYNKAKE
jgi:D-serine dehydratase